MDKNPNVREAAVGALDNLKQLEAVTDLRSDQEQQVESAAADGGSLGGEIIPFTPKSILSIR